MSSITFDELIDRLPTARRLPLAQLAGPAVEAPDHKDFFVAPVLMNVWQPEAKTSVVLVSARGAVGKTTFADAEPEQPGVVVCCSSRRNQQDPEWAQEPDGQHQEVVTGVRSESIPDQLGTPGLLQR